MDDLDAARDDLIGRGVNVSEVFHYAGGPFNNAVEKPRVAGRDPEGRSYFSFMAMPCTVFFVPSSNCPPSRFSQEPPYVAGDLHVQRYR